jgi:DNA-binding XRE family transcriptional regulator
MPTDEATTTPRQRRPRPLRVTQGRRPCDVAKARLREMGKTQLWLAGQVGYTPQTVNVYLNGKKLFVYNPDLTRRMCRALKITLDDLYRAY